MADLTTARRWLMALGGACTARVNSDEAADFVDSFAPMLASRFPDQAFTAETLEAVAAQCKYLPTYGELVPLLRAAVREARQAQQHAIEYAGPPVREAPPRPIEPAPEWCFTRPVGSSKPLTVKPLYLTRTQLTEAYRQAGVRGPQVPDNVVPLRPAAAAPIHSETKRGPVVDA